MKSFEIISAYNVTIFRMFHGLLLDVHFRSMHRVLKIQNDVIRMKYFPLKKITLFT